MDQVLDGKTPVKVVPFDAHEQVVRGTYTPTTFESPDVKNVSEYPKAIGHVDREGNPVTLEEISKSKETHFEPVVAKSAEHEEELKAKEE